MGIYYYTLRDSKKDIERIFLDGKDVEVYLMKYSGKVSYSRPDRETRVHRRCHEAWAWKDIPAYFHTEYCKDMGTGEVKCQVYHNPQGITFSYELGESSVQLIGSIVKRRQGKRVIKIFRPKDPNESVILV